MESPPRHSRSMSQHSNERRPLGPRSPSPLPPPKSPQMRTAVLPSMDDELALETPLRQPRAPATPSRRHDPHTGIPRSKRQPLFPTGNTEITPRPAVNSISGATSNTVEPLSIKKKTSVRSSSTSGSPTSPRKPHTRNSPLIRARMASPRRVSPQVRNMKSAASIHAPHKYEGIERLLQVSQTTKEDVCSTNRTIEVLIS